MNQTMLRQLLWLWIICFAKSQELYDRKKYIINKNYQQCDARQCILIEDILNLAIDFNAEPCDDFVKFACKRSSERNYDMREQNRQFDRFEVILTSMYYWNTTNKALKVERDVYKFCKIMDGQDRERQLNYEEAAYKKFQKEVQSERIFMNYGRNERHLEHWRTYDRRYALRGFGFAFFDFDIVERESDESSGVVSRPKRYIQIRPTSTNVLELRDLLSSYVVHRDPEQRSEEPPSRYRYTQEEKVERYDQLKDLMDKLNAIIPHLDSQNKRHLIPQSLDEWIEEYEKKASNDKSKIHWHTYFKDLLYNVPGEKDFLIQNEQFFFNLDKILGQYDNEIIEFYIHLRALSKFIGFRLAKRDNQNIKYSLIPYVEPLACTPGFLIGTAHEYTRKHLRKPDRDLLEELFSKWKTQVKNQLGSNGYDLPTDLSYHLLDYLDNAKEMIGYPSWLSDQAFVENFYGDYKVSGTYFENQINFMRIWQEKKLQPIQERKNYRHIINMDDLFKALAPETVVSTSVPEAITIPMRAFTDLTYPFFSEEIPEVFNFASAVTLIGQKIYFAWLNEINYAKKAPHCMRSQATYQMHHGDNDENLNKVASYILALNMSYAMWPTKDTYPIQFAKFGAIPDLKTFFITFAQSLCETQHFHAYPYSLDNPSEFINLAVSNVADFKRSFGCSRNYKLHKKQICDPLEGLGKKSQ